MKRRRERKLEAYRDGALGESDRKRIERDLEHDLDTARYVQRSAALGGLIRDAWSEGPAAPSAERLLASIAPEMRRIDAERASTSAPGRAFAALYHWLRDGLDAVDGTWIAAGGAAAALLVAFLLVPRTLDPGAPDAVAGLAAPAPSALPLQLASDSGPEFVGELGWPSAVYDLAQEDVPLLISEKDGGIVILLGEPEPLPGDDISSFEGGEGLA